MGARWLLQVDPRFASRPIQPFQGTTPHGTSKYWNGLPALGIVFVWDLRGTSVLFGADCVGHRLPVYLWFVWYWPTR